MILTAQIIGTISIFILFCFKLWIAINPLSSRHLLRMAILWTTVYIFFLFILRLLSLFNIGTLDGLRVVSGFSALIPLVAVMIHLYLDRKLERTIE